MQEQLERIAEKYFKLTVEENPNNSGTFKYLIPMQVDGETKPLLLLGNAHGLPFEDGHCIAVLNPDEGLTGKLIPGCAYSSGQLKEIVQGKCDMMLDLFIETYKNNPINLLAKYKNRSPQAAKFRIR